MKRTPPNSPAAVRAWRESITLPTYEPAPPDKNPMFLEKRVYQGSSGKVYPLPFTDRIAEEPTPRKWQAIWIENEFLKVLVLPEIGGRIHRILDKTNNYDLIYHQPVIKPALVGLAGPWISGGIEFNWPQHHRPATFMPVDTEIERHEDGSVTVWCSDHDPMARMKGMHGVCLQPGRAYVELQVRVCNRTPFTQTFLWWANVATRVHEAYQSFFPPDVYYVADHARRSMTEYPLAQGHYYGVSYGERGRKGVPPCEIPAQFVPPHCLKTESRKPKSEINPKPEARSRPLAADFRNSEFGLGSEFGFRISDLPDYAPNDLSFFANIPVPTSYMCMGSREDFFGGYDYQAQAGIVHLANHHISPGKKQWTWGNHEFGYAWDRNLTEARRKSEVRSSESEAGPKPEARSGQAEFPPYIEIMAGVYTDNQPDFSFLQPGETKSWSQHWYPIQNIGPAQHANLEAAVSLRSRGRQSAPISIGVAVTRAFPRACITLSKLNAPTAVGGYTTLARFTRNLAPGKPLVAEVELPEGIRATDLVLRVTDSGGREIITYQPKPRAKGEVPPPATEPPAPADIASADELFVTGLHLEQYRHATRCPTLYWREALRRDPGDARCNNAMGLWHLKRGEFKIAEGHFRQAIERLTRRNANPADGEPFYNLGLCLRYQAEAVVKSEIRNPKPERGPKSEARTGADAKGFRISGLGLPSDFGFRVSDLLSSAYAAFYKATWNQAWAGAAYLAIAELDCRHGDWAKAAEHAHRAYQASAFNQRAMNLWALALCRSGEADYAETLLRAFRRTDPLDWWTRHLLGEEVTCDTQTLLDLALDYARAGFYAEAIELLGRRTARTSRSDPRDLGTAPLVHYYLGWLHTELGNDKAALAEFKRAAALPTDYCFPSRLEEIAILETAMAANPDDARAPYYLGNLLYDRRRHEEAIRLWERSAKLDPSFSVVWRNLGIGYFNRRRQPAKARAAYERARRAEPTDARLLYERDQLWKREGIAPRRRLRELEQHLELVRQRDDLSVELCALFNQVGRHADALALVSSRHFQPWEGGEGGPLGQWVRSHLALGKEAFQRAVAADISPRKLRKSAPTHGGGYAHKQSLLTSAAAHFEAALTAPRNLGEAKHLLANQSDIHYWLGCALAELGQAEPAHQHWLAAASFKGDFQEMSVRAFSEMTYYSALSWKKLGQRAKAKKLFHDLLTYAQQLQQSEAKIDCFATSLPTMLLFDDDLQFRQETTALFLQAQAQLGLGRRTRAKTLLESVLRRDPNHALAADLHTELASQAAAS
jgi:tetratricopeptide (TPR) repeat protein